MSALPSHPRILWLEAHGAYFDGMRAEFAPHCTSIIGSKGCGKTTLFELICFGLGVPSLTGRNAVKPMVRKNLGDGFVRIGFETEHGVVYVAERGIKDEAPRVFTPDGTRVTVPPDFFQVDAYSQDEIEQVGANKVSQLALLDRLAGDDLRAVNADVADVTALLDAGALELLALEKEIVTLEGEAGEARSIEEQLKPLLEAEGPDADLVKAGHAAKRVRGRERQTLVAARDAIDETRADLAKLIATSTRKLGAVVAVELGEEPNGALMARAMRELTEYAGVLAELGARAAARADEATAAIGAARDELDAVHAQQDLAYDGIQARQQEDETLVTKRARLQERYASLAGAIGALDERTAAHAEQRAARAAVVDRLVALRDVRHAARLRVVEMLGAHLKNDGIEVHLEQDGNDEAFRALLREAFAPITNNQPKWLVDRIAGAGRPDQLVAIVRAQDTAILIAKAGLQKNPERAAQAIAALTQNAHLYALEAVGLDDVASIVVTHGKVPKDTTECSPGQRAGAILPIVLLQTKSPLLIDQPDDNIDPDFLCNSILPRIVEMRGEKQFIFVTHHANVPVLLAAEQTIMIASDGAHGECAADGPIPKMRPWIVTKMEGGQKAFDARRRAYEDKQDDPR